MNDMPHSCYTPGKGLPETIVDFFLWRARQHTQDQHIWIPPIEWGQALTHDTDTNVRHLGTTSLQRAPAEKDHTADRSHPEQGKQGTAPSGDTALRAAGLRTPQRRTPPPPTDSGQPPPEVWCTVLERRHYYVVAATAASPGPQWVIQGTDSMLAPGAAPPGAIGEPTTRSTWDWPCSACPSGSSAPSHPQGPLKQAQAEGIIVSWGNLNVHVMKE